MQQNLQRVLNEAGEAYTSKNSLETVVINIIDGCNFNCPQCAYGAIATKTFNTFEYLDFAKLTLQAVSMGVKRFRFLGLGEPTLNPHLTDMIGVLRDNSVLSHVLSNGTFVLNPQLRKRILSCPPDILEVSLDAFSSQTFTDVRGGSSRLFDRLTIELEAFSIEFRQLPFGRKKRPLLRVSFVRHQRSEAEWQKFVDHWVGKVDEIFPRASHDFSRKAALGMPTDDYRNSPCLFMDSKIFVDHDGTFHCCSTDFARELELGKFPRTGLKEAWMSSIRLQAIESMKLQGVASPQCSSCSRCADLIVG